MNQLYTTVKVCGIVQTQVNGAWSEQGTLTVVKLVNVGQGVAQAQAQARAQALATYAAPILAVDALALVRWYNTPTAMVVEGSR